MNRKAAQFWWNEFSGLNIKIPSNVAYYEKNWTEDEWKITTWADINKKRTDKIKSNIYQKRLHEEIKPCLVWVFSHGHWIMGGYYTIIKTINKEFYLNFRGHDISNLTTAKELQLKVMQAFPLCLPMPELFYEWMYLFTKNYHNDTFYKGWKNQGITKAYCKLDKYGNLIDINSVRDILYISE